MQHGFIKGLSCTTQLLQVFHEIGHNLDKGLGTDIIYLDFPKGFDSVCHQKCFSKLLYFGIDGPLLKWFESYLSARKQRVVINGSYSSWSEVKSGVIQGSILGPVLFLMFVNDMPEVLRSSNRAMFADDSKCFKAIRSFSDCSALQTDLSALIINPWSVENEIYFHPSKIHNLRISRKKASPARLYTVNGTTVEMVAKEKDLGITITKDVTWNNHLKAIVSKVIKRTCFALLNTKTLILLYTSLVRSYFCYASQAGAPQSIIQHLRLVENTQRQATKFIYK